ncbi:MAG: Hsp20/alpha crystallin family protein [Candidatus Limnocylindrales bacterium]
MRVSRAFDRLFDDAAFRPLAWGGPVEARLPLDVTSSEDAVLIEAALPGVDPQDVEITVHQDNLTIAVKEQAQAETTDGERVYRELRRSSGTRTLTLPSGMDTEHASADFDNGMLRLRIPRAEAAKPRQIRVNTASTTAKQVAAEAQGTEDGTDADAGQQA